MDILMSETCWAHKWNKIASDIKLVFYSSTIKRQCCDIHLCTSWLKPKTIYKHLHDLKPCQFIHIGDTLSAEAGIPRHKRGYVVTGMGQRAQNVLTISWCNHCLRIKWLLECCLTVHLLHEIKWNPNLMKQGQFYWCILSSTCFGYARHQGHWLLNCSIWFCAL